MEGKAADRNGFRRQSSGVLAEVMDLPVPWLTVLAQASSRDFRQ